MALTTHKRSFSYPMMSSPSSDIIIHTVPSETNIAQLANQRRGDAEEERLLQV